MWPFSRKPHAPKNDAYWDYVEVEQFTRDSRFAQLDEEERAAVDRGLAAFQGQRLHPEIAEATFAAFTAAALANHGLDIAHYASDEPNLVGLAVAALQHAHSFYPHPIIISHLAEVFASAGLPQDAEKARAESSRQQARWVTRDTDTILLSQLVRF
jgi:hypothetical protein